MGYNFALKLGDKILVGRQSENFSLKPKVKQSITKEDQGNSNSSITGYDATFSITGVMMKGTGDTLTKLDSDAILEAAMKKGDEAKLPFVWERSTLKSYQGQCIITDYAENTDSENEGTYNLSLQVVGAMTPKEQA